MELRQKNLQLLKIMQLQRLRPTDLSLVVGHLAMTCDAEKRNMATEGFLESVTCYQKTKIVEIMAERG